jgi:hypothetical protein
MPTVKSYTVVLPDEAGIQRHCECILSDEDIETLRRFAAEAIELREYPFYRASIALVRSPEDYGDVPSKQESGAFLHAMRPFLLQQERTHLPKVINILKRAIRESWLHNTLDSFRNDFNRPTSYSLPVDFAKQMNNWLNGVEYHRDDDKRDSLWLMLGDLRSSQRQTVWSVSR